MLHGHSFMYINIYQELKNLLYLTMGKEQIRLLALFMHLPFCMLSYMIYEIIQGCMFFKLVKAFEALKLVVSDWIR